MRLAVFVLLALVAANLLQESHQQNLATSIASKYINFLFNQINIVIQNNAVNSHHLHFYVSFPDCADKSGQTKCKGSATETVCDKDTGTAAIRLRCKKACGLCCTYIKATFRDIRCERKMYLQNIFTLSIISLCLDCSSNKAIKLKDMSTNYKDISTVCHNMKSHCSDLIYVQNRCQKTCGLCDGCKYDT